MFRERPSMGWAAPSVSLLMDGYCRVWQWPVCHWHDVALAALGALSDFVDQG